ncbi:hypothetical protein B0T25DRAFT_553260 [Lasiosphaeria hispida]|uniref:Glucose-methanol-choline oxidoreductase N-terminal domain-containing protein n=1 Tax=Lasiosphaeria hispida TaxID=260671 RepID=A0AAJ0HCR3_9PEZI|nr:hypothetical protein B0T25DRAFT_553260 [Lasiosphaeria hispida]
MIAIRLEASCYQVSVNDCLIHTYNKRIIEDAQRVSYECNSYSVFTDPIEVTVVKPSEEQPTTKPACSYEQAYFTPTAKGMAEQSETDPFDYVIIGSGIGGGILATDLLDKNKRFSASQSNLSAQSTCHKASSIWDPSSVQAQAKGPINRTKRILVIERGNLLFPTHSLNMPRPTNRGTYSQMNDLFYNNFKHQWEMDDETREKWVGGAVYCLGGRSTVWGLFSPRIDDNIFRKFFPEAVYGDLTKKYLRKAEEWMNLSYPQTLPLHCTLQDSLNIHPLDSKLPATQWEWGRVSILPDIVF